MAKEFTQDKRKKIRVIASAVGLVYLGALVIHVILISPRLSFTTGNGLTDTVVNILYAIPIAVTLVTCLWAARNSDSYKRLWRLMSTGMALWFSGIVCMQAYMLAPDYSGIPSPSLADLFAVAYIPIMFGVILSMARIRRPFDSAKKQFFANMTMALLAMFMLSYELIILPLWYAAANMSFMERLFIIVYPTLDFMILAALVFASHKLLENHIEGFAVLLIAAFGVSILADIPAFMLGYQTNLISMIIIRITAILIAFAAIDEVTGAFIGKKERCMEEKSDIVSEQARRAQPIFTTILPFIATMTIPITWLLHYRNGHAGGLPLLFAVSTIVIFMAIHRNHKLALDNAALFAKSMRDRLTGLNNHRYFHESLDRAVAKAKRLNQKVSLLIIDIDEFSKINNAYGHAHGDALLTLIGKTILTNIREDDEACRLNGDEFGIILPNTSKAEAVILAEAARDAVYKKLGTDFDVADITVSIGSSTYPTFAKNKKELIQTSEGALYWCKLHGKNSIMAYDPQIVKTLSPEERAQKAEEVALVDMVSSLAKAVDARDPYTRQHSLGVSKLATRLARNMKLDKAIVNRIRMAGLLHDVGKIGIPDCILNKPGRLTDEEMYTIKSHPIVSAQIIQSTSLKEMVTIVRAHHERWDGQGYPDGLEAEKIPLEARILAIADTFDAMTTDRPYRKALSVEDALAEIDRCSGTQFDPDIARIFLQLFPDKNSQAAENKYTTGKAVIS
ncbi:MAG: diguanylate cyclase [Candidatus Aquicultor sp.]|nr:diguanylate cyclase [Candidatus Aquicultor sp.]